MKTQSRDTGMSLIETTITLSVMMMLTAVVAPAGMTMIQQSRDIQVQRDCSSLRDAMIKLLIDTNQQLIRVQQGHGPRVSLLVSDGAVPGVGMNGDTAWLSGPDGAGTVDLLNNYLVENQPAGNPANAWAPPRSAGASGWRGAYLTGAASRDPWGHRYAINVQHLGTRNDVIVLSAGPDGEVDTPFTARGVLPGGDDRYVLVR
jgi:type II secretory pathway pseudopilin PulG